MGTQLLLESLGFDAIDVSGNNWMENDLLYPEEQSFFRRRAEILDANVPVILTGGNRSPDLLEEILRQGGIDFFGVARPLVREPYLPDWWRLGKSDFTRCISCNLCFHRIAGGLKCHQI